MAITIKHAKTDTIADWTQADLDAQIALGNFPPGTTLANIVLPSDWNNDHTFTGTLGVSNGGTGATTLTGYVKGNGTSAFTANTTVPSTDITGLGTMSTQNANSVSITGGSISGTTVSGYIPTTEKGVANGVATLDGGGTVPISQLPAAVLGALSYQGTWNASTNTPTLTSSVGTKGYYYVVNVAGSTNLNGITDWVVGDWAVYNGSAWQKVDNTDSVTSVNGYTGTVVLTQTDISGTVPTSRTITAGTGLTGGGDLSANRTLAIDSTVATLTGTQTLTNKTLTAPKVDLINDTNGNEILGLSPTTSATDYLVVKNGIGVGVPLHLYADGSSTNTGLHIQPKGTGLVTISDGTDFNKGIRFRSSSSAASAITLLDAVSTAGRVVTLPDATTTLVGRDTTDTLTNKSISGSTNTLSNIGNSSLTNSAITINGTSTSLGGSISVGTVTSVTGTAPVVSSGGATPAISMAAASSSTNGYLTSTDWTTFNSKGTGTVTSVTATSPVTSTGGATPVIAMPAATTSVNGYLTSTDWNTFNSKGSGTVTSVAALTLGTTGTDLSSTVATGTTTPVITLNVPTASASNRGALSSTDWSTFNGKISSQWTTTGSDIYYNTGNVGIGTSSPAYKLDVRSSSAGTANFQNSTAGEGNIRFECTNVSTPVVGYIGANAFGNNLFALGTAAGSIPVSIWTNATERMRIDTSGNLGIGTTSPSNLLTVGSSTNRGTVSVISTSSTSAYVKLDATAVASGKAYGIMSASSANGNFDIYDFTSAAYRLTIDSAGNVLIPSNTLYGYQAAPTSKAAATTLTGAELIVGILNTTGTTYTITLPTGTNIDAAVSTSLAANGSFDWYVINTASGTITIGANGNTTMGTLTIATGVSAHFRFRKTAANTYTVYRVS